MGWAGCYDLTLTCDHSDHVLPQTIQFNYEHGASCRRAARAAGWRLKPDGSCLCPKHSGRKKEPPRGCKPGFSRFVSKVEAALKDQDLIERCELCDRAIGNGRGCCYLPGAFGCKVSQSKAQLKALRATKTQKVAPEEKSDV